MTPFTRHHGVVAAFIQANIDTDAIIPSREMKQVSKEGLGEGLFAARRYTLPGSREINPDFILNQAPYHKASIILGGENFGCGSSREHAAWALKDFGIRIVIAPSFGAIFYNNCINNGILPVVLPEATIHKLDQHSQAQSDKSLSVDLTQQIISWSDGQCEFSVPSSERQMLLQGLDKIAITEGHSAKIQQFETNDRLQRPWAYLNPA